MTQAKITQLKIYPLKASQGISLKAMEIIDTGPRYDREWMLVDENNNFISQRTHPQMGQLTPQLNDENLIIHHAQLGELSIPLQERFTDMIEVKIFNKPTLAELVVGSGHQWFSDFLGQNVKFVRSPQSSQRKTSGNHGPIKSLQFPDGYPFLMTNQSTLDELNEKLVSPISMDRFRPNIVIDNVQANEEDRWTQFMINDIKFLSVKSCTRCVVIDTDPQTGLRNKEVTRTLKSYRTKDGAVVFGRNLSHTNIGTIRLGEKLDDVITQ